MRGCDVVVAVVVAFVMVVVMGITAIQVSNLTRRIIHIEHALMLDR